MPGFPAWTLTVGAMIDGAAAVRALCTSCATVRDVDLVALSLRVGRDFSLVDRRCRCRLTPGCAGWNRFYYLAGVYRPLWRREWPRSSDAPG